MKRSAQYREFADQCLELAKRAKTEEERKVLHEMAMTWVKLAEDTDQSRP
jgi:hypothetical protein